MVWNRQRTTAQQLPTVITFAITKAQCLLILRINFVMPLIVVYTVLYTTEFILTLQQARMHIMLTAQIYSTNFTRETSTEF